MLSQPQVKMKFLIFSLSLLFIDIMFVAACRRNIS